MNITEFCRILDNQVEELLQNNNEKLRTKERSFIAWCLLNLSESDITEAEAVDAVVDGTQEKGIDAIYIPDKEGEIIILQTKYHKDPNGKGVKKNELVKLFAGVDWLFDGDLSKIDSNPNFLSKATEFRESYYNFDYSKIRIIYSGTFINDCGKEEIDEIEKYKSKLDEKGAPFEIEIFNTEKLNNVLISNIHRKYKIDLEMKFLGKPFTYDKEKSGARAIVGSVKGEQLAKIYKKHNYRIFDINIRNFLGNVKINQGITRTAIDQNDAFNFWFYNNGVTFVCDNFSFRSLEDTVVKLENAQIINGCQTVNSLFHAGKELSNDVEILVKIIEKESDINFVRRVTIFANSQNAVKSIDLVGTDTIQLELKRMLLDKNCYYETRRGDYKAERDSLEKSINRIITLKQAAQGLCTVFKLKPGIAKKEYPPGEVHLFIDKRLS